MTVLDGLRLMSFSSYFMGTLILVPDSSPRAFREVGYFAKGFFVRGVLEVLAWLGGHGWLVIHGDHASSLFCESMPPSPAHSAGPAEGSARLSFVLPHAFF
jgi:hypothetical protein